MDDEFRNIVKNIQINDIAKMQPKKDFQTSLDKFKVVLDKTNQFVINQFFSGQIAKETLLKVANYTYKHDKSAFEYLYLVIRNIPNYPITLQHSNYFTSSQLIQEPTWNQVRIHPLFREPRKSIISHRFEPKTVFEGFNTFDYYYKNDKCRHYVIISSKNQDIFRISLQINSVLILNGECPISSFPFDITDGLTPGNCHICANFTHLESSAMITIMPLELVPIGELEAEIIQRKVHVFKGEWGFCPISGKLIEFPVRGINCVHSGNFDFSSFIKMATLTHKWICPICSKPLPYEELALDDTAYAEMLECMKSDLTGIFNS